MTYARKLQVSLQDTAYYHVMGRCVRRAWLWGVDEYSGRDYSHRKEWMTRRLRQLDAAFAIDVCAYAILCNHYHLVVHVDRVRAQGWSQFEVVERWRVLFSVPEVVEHWLAKKGGDAEAQRATLLIECWRERLYNLSWFMKCLNEHLARLANLEDGVVGKFWESRYKSQALLDEAGLLTAMAYVDLNPVRAGIASCPEESEFTSIYDRIRRIPSEEQPSPHGDEAPVRLMAFRGSGQEGASIPYGFQEYLELVDWTGRAIRPDRAGAIGGGLPPIMQRLNIDAREWELSMRTRGNAFGRAIGALDRLREHAKLLGQCWIRGLRRSELLYAR
jgi:hypothetical protein